MPLRAVRVNSIYQAQARFFTSPRYPHVHVHKQGSKQAAVSYLSSQPTETSRAVVGYAPLNKDGTDVDLSRPSRFRINPSFIEALNEVCLKHAHDDPICQAMAATQDSGHLHIADEKNPPPYGRIPYPEDIIGTIRIEHGKLVRGSFVPMREAYRPVSGEGIVKLSEYLEGRMLSLLKSEVDK
ncbi:Putative uncharacterized protein [Taphrina deformans PYCC 5710]|uniref:Uncharacterized protein n=1 Tax=Taphrina deformans (strain PYCC 5710 / ATCC 11124 / CBS 356.35 / IMI 108563 / JCM 9778 / NBRC 8474) TaxID=1097556 RepID=R4X9I7_TAPDE|nr:Putative uncharacterized protein [Taphrina deformans PYCC 5710]|eukprot:CCG82421.1 Putative uncharacterized protein [Taphrina deformans PYCC 5710]